MAKFVPTSLINRGFVNARYYDDKFVNTQFGNNGVFSSQLGELTLTFEGDLSYDATLGHSVGKVKTITFRDDTGNIIATTTDLDMRAAPLFKVLANGDGKDFFETVFAGADDIKGSQFKDRIHGYAGDDTIAGYQSKDRLFGEEGNDKLMGGKGMDTLHGGDGADSLFGGVGHDALYGGNDDDKLMGGKGMDTLHGGDGADSLFGDDGHDALYGGKGNDWLEGGKHADRLWGNDGDDKLKGDSGNDVLNGGNGNDSLVGGEVDDKVYGGSGDDFVYGGIGADTVEGGAGNDVIKGGPVKDEADILIFRNGHGHDNVGGFDVNADTLVLDSAYWEGVTTAQQLVAKYGKEHMGLNDKGEEVVVGVKLIAGDNRIYLAGVSDLAELVTQIQNLDDFVI